MERIIFTIEQLLDVLGIVENTLRGMIEHNGFPHPSRMRAKLFWLVSEVVGWLSACPKAWGGAQNAFERSKQATKWGRVHKTIPVWYTGLASKEVERKNSLDKRKTAPDGSAFFCARTLHACSVSAD